MTLTKADVEGNADTTLDTATDVVAVPGDALWDIGVDSHSEEETSGVLDVRVLGRDQEDQTENGHETEADHENTSSLESVGRPATGESAETGDDVWRNGHQLSGVVRVSESLDDGGEEERVGIKRSVDSSF